MLKKLKKIIVVFLVCLVSGSLFACGAGIEVYEASDDENTYFTAAINLNMFLAAELEHSAAINEFYPTEKWTVEEYFKKYFGTVSDGRDMSYSYSGKSLVKNSYQYTFNLIIANNGDMGDAMNLQSERQASGNIFVRTYKLKRQDRFNFYQNQFEEIYARQAKNELLMSDYSTEMGALILGKRIYYKDMKEADAGNGFIYDERYGCCYERKLPSISQAFPKINMNEYYKFGLENYWNNNYKLKIESDGKFKDDEGNVYYLFKKTMADGESMVEYSYYRLDPTGWYLVAIGAGLITVGLIILVSKNKKKNIAQSGSNGEGQSYGNNGGYGGQNSGNNSEHHTNNNVGNPFGNDYGESKTQNQTQNQTQNPKDFNPFGNDYDNKK